MNIQSIDDINLERKTVLVRVDFNVPMEEGVISDDTRIKAVLPTVKKLREAQCRVVLMSHLGRPKGKKNKLFSLEPVLKKLENLIGQDSVHFAPDIEDPGLKDVISAMRPRDIMVLENLRFYPEEEKNDEGFAKRLANLGDIYVNDAFSASHRAHASVDAITRFLPSFAGKLLFNELLHLEKYLGRPSSPFWAIVGGAKISTKLPLIKTLISKVDGLVIGGAMANTLLLSMGKNIGTSLVEPSYIKECNDILDMAHKNNCTLILPTDVVVALKPESKTHAIKHVDAVNDGTIDVIVSDHKPEDEESKRLTFAQAATGASGIETLLPLSLELYHNKSIKLKKLIASITYNPAKILGISKGSLDKGNDADLCIFDLNKPWVVNKNKIKSKSKNTPIENRKMQGQVLKTFVKGEEVYERV